MKDLTTVGRTELMRMVEQLQEALPRRDEDEAAAWCRIVTALRKGHDERDEARAEVKRLRELVRLHRRACWGLDGLGAELGEVHNDHDAVLYHAVFGSVLGD